MEISFNLQVWNGLPDRLKGILIDQVRTFSSLHFAGIQRANVEAWSKLAEAGTTVTRLSEDPALRSDAKRAQEIGKERKALEGVVGTLERYRQALEAVVPDVCSDARPAGAGAAYEALEERLRRHLRAMLGREAALASALVPQRFEHGMASAGLAAPVAPAPATL